MRLLACKTLGINHSFLLPCTIITISRCLPESLLRTRIWTRNGLEPSKSWKSIVAQIKTAGFRTREKLISMGSGSTFPANLKFIISDCDRNTVELFISGFKNAAVTSPTTQDIPDLRAVLNESHQSPDPSKIKTSRLRSS